MMGKVKKTMLVYECDAPGCDVEYFLEKDDPDLPDGFHGEVTEVASWGGSSKVSWYACTAEHIQAAVLAVLAQEQ